MTTGSGHRQRHGGSLVGVPLSTNWRCVFLPLSPLPSLAERGTGSDVLSPPPDMRACTSNPCANNGTCTTMQKGHYQCTCAPGFSGETCQKKDGPCEVNG